MEFDPDAESLAIEDENGRYEQGTDLARPTWLADAVVLPDDLVITTDLTAGTIRSLIGTTSASAASVHELTEQALRDAGWPIDASMLDDAADTFALLATTDADEPIDFEFAGGELRVVVGRIRVTPN